MQHRQRLKGLTQPPLVFVKGVMYLERYPVFVYKINIRKRPGILHN